MDSRKTIIVGTGSDRQVGDRTVWSLLELQAFEAERDGACRGGGRRCVKLSQVASSRDSGQSRGQRGTAGGRRRQQLESTARCMYRYKQTAQSDYSVVWFWCGCWKAQLVRSCASNVGWMEERRKLSEGPRAGERGGSRQWQAGDSRASCRWAVEGRNKDGEVREGRTVTDEVVAVEMVEQRPQQQQQQCPVLGKASDGAVVEPGGGRPYPPAHCSTCR